MDIIWVARWNGLEILIPKHMWKSKIRLLEQKLDENRYVTFLSDPGVPGVRSMGPDLSNSVQEVL